METYLIDVTARGRHVALVSTHDKQFVDRLIDVFRRAGIDYRFDVTTSPSPPKKKQM
jgi:hypothetical protein